MYDHDLSIAREVNVHLDCISPLSPGQFDRSHRIFWSIKGGTSMSDQQWGGSELRWLGKH
jgi:hypothetical protein